MLVNTKVRRLTSALHRIAARLRFGRKPKGHGGAARGELVALVRQAKLGASCRVEVPAEEGLTNHSYRVLQLWRKH